MKVLFLDISGVLNNGNTPIIDGYEQGLEEEKLSFLKRIIDVTSAKIVLVSSWKNYWFKEASKKHLQNFIATYMDEKFKEFGLEIYDKVGDGFNRAGAVLHWLLENKEVENFAILDDYNFGYLQFFEGNYVQPYGVVGLTEQDAKTVIKILNEE